MRPIATSTNLDRLAEATEKRPSLHIDMRERTCGSTSSSTGEPSEVASVQDGSSANPADVEDDPDAKLCTSPCEATLKRLSALSADDLARKMPLGMCAEMPDPASLEDSDEDLMLLSPTKSARRRMRRRRQREALKLDAPSQETSSQCGGEALDFGFSVNDAKFEESIANDAPLVNLNSTTIEDPPTPGRSPKHGSDSHSNTPFALSQRRVPASTLAEAGYWSTPVSPCKLQPAGIVSTSPVKDAEHSCMVEASTRVPSKAGTPTSLTSNNVFGHHSCPVSMFADLPRVPTKLEPCSPSNIARHGPRGITSTAPLVVSTARSPCGEASLRTPSRTIFNMRDCVQLQPANAQQFCQLGVSPQAQASFSPKAVHNGAFVPDSNQSMASNIFVIGDSLTSKTGFVPDSKQSIASNAFGIGDSLTSQTDYVGNVASDALRILFGDSDIPSNDELLAKLHAAAPDLYEE